jgi:hypothetical protein
MLWACIAVALHIVCCAASFLSPYMHCLIISRFIFLLNNTAPLHTVADFPLFPPLNPVVLDFVTLGNRLPIKLILAYTRDCIRRHWLQIVGGQAVRSANRCQWPQSDV